MKKFICLMICLFVMLSFVPSAFAVTNTEYINEDITIVTDKNAAATEKYAGETLLKYLSAKTDKKVSLADKKKEDGSFIIEIRKDTAMEEGCYNIKSTADGVEIEGGANRGCIYGVYYFLEKFASYRCFTAEDGMVSIEDGIKRPVDVNIKKNAVLEYTDTDWISPRDVEYSLMNGLNGGPYRNIPAEMGGTVDYLSNFAHTLTTEFCSSEKYFNEHPEYFALHNGKRNAQQLCLMNDDVYNIVLTEVMELLKEKHDPSAALQIVSLTQNDSGEDGAFCECEKCKAVDDENGSHAGTMITFVNRIADAVAAKGYDNISIDTFAYRYTRTAPAKVRPHDNVIVRLCSIECCFSHIIPDTSCVQNENFMEDLKAWGKICSRLYVWGYANNYAYTLGIFPDFGVLQRNIITLYEHNVKGIYEEGNFYMDTCNTEFGELRSYLISKLLQDPYCDFYGTMDEFLKYYYGDGWQNIRDFIDMLVINTSEGHLEIYSTMEESLHFTDEEIKKCDELWENAKAECKNEKQLEHINRSELSWRYWKASVGKGEFSGVLSGAKHRKQLCEDITAYGNTTPAEGKYGEITPVSGYMFMSADKWFNASKGGLFVDICYGLVWVLYGVIIILALLTAIKAIKYKRFVFILPLPLLAACSELFMWNRRAYLAWKDIGEYTLTVIIAAVIFVLMFILCERAGKGNIKKYILSAVIGTAAFFVPYEAALLIINIVLYNGQGNNFACSVAFLLSAVCMTCVMSVMLKRLKTNV